MDNLAIWMMGSNGSGKTTQSAMLHRYFNETFDNGNFKFQIFEENKGKDDYSAFTQLSSVSSNLGRFIHPLTIGDNIQAKPTQCTGTDTLTSRDQIERSYDKALKQTPIVIVDGIMATSTWIDFIKRPNVKVLLVLLDILTLEQNLLRIGSRRATKKSVNESEIFFEQKTLDNIQSKVKGFKSMYDKLAPQVDQCIEIDANGTPEYINHLIEDVMVRLL